jgi:hypothetical protein
MEETTALFDGVQVISQFRGNQKVCAYTGEDYVADYCAILPGTPRQFRIRGGELITAIGGKARLSVGAHRTKRFIITLKDAGEDPYLSVRASELR